VGVIKDQNRVVVRTRDIDAMNEIKKVAKDLDVQSSMLLMEVKVLQIDLSDGFNSLFDFNIHSGSFNVSGLGGIAGTGASSAITSGAASAAFGPALLATVVSNNFEARLQLAQNENRVTQLATPLLLTSNQEVSRFFVGSEIPILTGYTAGSTTTSAGSTTQATVQQPTPIYVQYKIGQTLLLTPNINADKTVNIQVLVEQSTVVPNGATILVPETNTGVLGVGSATSTLAPVQIDTVNEKSFSGSVMAKDGNSVAVGGLIEEGAKNQQIATPFLGDVPLLGFFFRQEAQTRSRTELVIIIKPHIIATPPDGQTLTEDFMNKNSIHPNATSGDSLNVYSNPDKQHKGYILDQPFKEYNNQDSLDRYKWDNPNPRR
jgi:general secretion pathway protein D